MAKKKQISSASNRESSSSDKGSSNGVEKAKKTRKKEPRDSPQKRSSVYRGVTRHRWTRRFEAHLWDKASWNESHSKKGRQVYLGAYDEEEAAARAYDLAALKYWGQDTILNFTLSSYEEELKEMERQSKEEYIGSLRRKSSGFSRGVSKYRGVARHHHNGRWEARIGRVFGNKYLYLGTYATQEEAATAYDMAAIEYRGLNAVTNFDLSRYIEWLRLNPEGSKSNSGLEINPSPTNPGLESRQHRFDQPRSPPPQQQELLRSSRMKGTIREADSPLSPSDDKPSSRCSFPEDIQTYFGCNDGVCFAEGEDTIFGELNAFETPIFQCGLDV